MADLSEGDEDPNQLAAHVGTDTFPDDMANEKCRGQKKSALLQKAEKALAEPACPVQTHRVGCQPVRQDIKIRRGKDETNLLNANRSYIIEALLLQSRADELYRGTHACTNCQNDHGYFASCRVLKGFRNGACANCHNSGDGVQRCSFVPEEVKQLSKRKKGNDTDDEGATPARKKGKGNTSTNAPKLNKVSKMDETDVYGALATQHEALASMHTNLALVHSNCSHLYNRLYDLSEDKQDDA